MPSGLADARVAGLAPLRGRLQPHEVRAAVAEAARAEAEPALSKHRNVTLPVCSCRGHAQLRGRVTVSLVCCGVLTQIEMCPCFSCGALALQYSERSEYWRCCTARCALAHGRPV